MFTVSCGVLCIIQHARMTAAGAVLWNVVEEHLDEAEFLLELWWAAARSAHFSLERLQRTAEKRLVAHLDGLSLGGEVVAHRLLWPTLAADADGGWPRATAATLALLGQPGTDARDRLLNLLGATPNEAVRTGIGRAFQVCARGDVDEAIRLALYATDVPTAQTALLSALAARRVDPGPILRTLLVSADGELLGAALGAASAGDVRALRGQVEDHLRHRDPAVRAMALRVGVIWNLGSAWHECATAARAGCAEAMLLVGVVGRTEDVPVLTAALARPETRGDALWALSFTGRVAAVEAALPLLDDEDELVPRLALEAVAAVTGLPVWESRFAAPSPPDEDGELPPLEEDLKRDLRPTPADELPRPASDEVRAWWRQRKQAFTAGQRYIGGEPASAAAFETALVAGPLRRSGPLACDIAIRSAGRLQFSALRIGYPRPMVPREIAMHRAPAWR